MMSAYDRWATKEGPDWEPIEVDAGTFDNDEDLWSIAPMDETYCDGPLCEDPPQRHLTLIGVYLGEDYEGRCVFHYKPFWIMDQDCERLFCEDCYYEATREVE
jgi:hypothetical protein